MRRPFYTAAVCFINKLPLFLSLFPLLLSSPRPPSLSLEFCWFIIHQSLHNNLPNSSHPTFYIFPFLPSIYFPSYLLYTILPTFYILSFLPSIHFPSYLLYTSLPTFRILPFLPSIYYPSYLLQAQFHLQ